jgi:hypothetical protein
VLARPTKGVHMINNMLPLSTLLTNESQDIDCIQWPDLKSLHCWVITLTLVELKNEDQIHVGFI